MRERPSRLAGMVTHEAHGARYVQRWTAAVSQIQDDDYALIHVAKDQSRLCELELTARMLHVLADVISRLSPAMIDHVSDAKILGEILVWSRPGGLAVDTLYNCFGGDVVSAKASDAEENSIER